jgi:hypothetical protein
VIETSLTTVLADEDPPEALLLELESDDDVDDDELVAEVDCDAVVEVSELVGELSELIDMAGLA